MNEVSMLPPNRIFLMRVCSDALVGAFIQKGDYIRCERMDMLERGQFGVVQTPYGILLRFIFFESGGYVRLESVSYDFPTLCLSPQEVQVIGRPLLLLRDLRDLRKSKESDNDA